MKFRLFSSHNLIFNTLFRILITFFLIKFLPQSLYHKCIAMMLAVLAQRTTNKEFGFTPRNHLEKSIR